MGGGGATLLDVSVPSPLSPSDAAEDPLRGDSGGARILKKKISLTRIASVAMLGLLSSLPT